MKNKKSAHSIRRKETIKHKNGLSALDQITVMLTFNKKDMETLLKSPAIGISGVLYDVPIFQIQRFLDEKTFGLQKYTLNKAKNQDPNQKNEIHE